MHTSPLSIVMTTPRASRTDCGSGTARRPAESCSAAYASAGVCCTNDCVDRLIVAEGGGGGASSCELVFLRRVFLREPVCAGVCGSTPGVANDGVGCSGLGSARGVFGRRDANGEAMERRGGVAA